MDRELIFQTAEEISRGSEIAISNGCLKDVAAIFGLHIGNILGKEIPTGTLIFQGHVVWHLLINLLFV